MRAAYGVAAIRAAEAELMARLPPGALMQRAAAGLARRVASLLPGVYGARVVLLVGGGNNGADALWAGARLAGRGVAVTALLAGRVDEPAHAALLGAGGRSRPAGGEQDERDIAGADVVVDGLTGIGGSGGLREPAARLAALTAGAGELGADGGRRSPVPTGRRPPMLTGRQPPLPTRHRPTVVAVDLPSGVDADTGRVDGPAVAADVTVTFGALKPGLLVAPAAALTGLVEVVDIGLQPHLPPPRLGALDAVDLAGLLPVPRGEASKYTRGVVGIAAGSEVYTGAAVLSTGGAVRAGAGMVRFAGSPHPAEQVRLRWPESVVTAASTGAEVVAAGRVQAWVVGPGLGTDERAVDVVAAVLRTGVPVLVDADGLTVLAEHPDLLRARTGPTLITPHAGEFARLLGCTREEAEADRLTWARRAAAELGVTVLLKGTTTVVADPDGTARINPTGTPWLGTAGSGDVLSGACGALLAGGLAPLEAGSCGAFLHGLAGQLAARGADPEGREAPVSAAQLLDTWSAAVRSVT